MDKNEWGKCICLGATSLLAAAVLKALPSAQVDKYSAMTATLNIVNEDKEVDSKLLASYAVANSMRVDLPVGAKQEFADYQDDDQKQEAGEEEFPTHN